MGPNKALLESVRKGLSAVLQEDLPLLWVRNLSGGDINQAALLQSNDRRWFLKYKQGGPDGMFAAEAQALEEIAAQQCIRVPSPIAVGHIDDTAWLLLEYLELSSSGSPEQLGEQLAALHRVKAHQFGWYRDNFIGSTGQINTYSNDWSAFWRDQRLKPQLAMAISAGHDGPFADKIERLLENMDFFMADHQPGASLLHGDLWAGNKAYIKQGEAVIFDPASYYGDRETDIAMTELFGGFEAGFYSAYKACYPLADGYQLRRDLYNLYHMLNHLNLFGATYLGACESISEKLMAQIT